MSTTVCFFSSYLFARATTLTEREARGDLTLIELNKMYTTVLSDKIQKLAEWNANKPVPPPLPPGARKKHGYAN